MIQNYMSIICSIFSIAEFIFLVSLSGLLLTFSAFLTLLTLTLTIANPLFLAIIAHLGRFIIYMMHLSVVYARKVLVSAKCTQVQPPANLHQHCGDVADIADIAADIADIASTAST